MDGTTVGSTGIVPPVPQFNPEPQVNLSQINSVPGGPPAAILPPQPATPIPIVQPPVQPQLSQVTPVYAPSPTNSVADIPQPAVKGIEFVQTPTVLPTPIAQLPPPITSVDPPTLPQTTISPPPPEQLMQPVLPPRPVQSPGLIQPTPEPAVSPLTVADMSGPANYAKIENQIADVDLDQMAGAIPAPTPAAEPITLPPPATAPVEPAVVPKPTTPANSYFQTGGSIISDVPITDSKSPFGGMDPRLIRRILIITAIVIVVGVAGFFIVSAITGSQSQQPQTTPVAETETSEDPVVTESPSTTEEPTSESPVTEEEPTTTPTTPTFTETPAVTTPPTETPVTTTTPTTPTPATSETVPTVANSGVQ